MSYRREMREWRELRRRIEQQLRILKLEVWHKAYNGAVRLRKGEDEAAWLADRRIARGPGKLL